MRSGLPLAAASAWSTRSSLVPDAAVAVLGQGDVDDAGDLLEREALVEPQRRD